jgi:ubiquinone/menaquinone biosynthesis C-methylase UbiE
MMHDHSVCSLKKAKKLDSWLRRKIHNPNRILKDYIKEGMTVLDFGCGPGMFSIELAKMVGSKGKVIAVDLQQGMLDIVADKIKGTELEKRIVLRKCTANSINAKEKVDFMLAFYVVHEVPDVKHFFKEAYAILKPKDRLVLAEPKKRVTTEEFQEISQAAKSAGFKINKKMNILFSRGILLQK